MRDNGTFVIWVATMVPKAAIAIKERDSVKAALKLIILKEDGFQCELATETKEIEVLRCETKPRKFKF